MPGKMGVWMPPTEKVLSRGAPLRFLILPGIWMSGSHHFATDSLSASPPLNSAVSLKGGEQPRAARSPLSNMPVTDQAEESAISTCGTGDV